MIETMSEIPEHSASTVPVTPDEAAPLHRTSRLNQAAAWVGIVAGVVFIVAVIFGTGFMLGKHSGGHGGFERHHEMGMSHRGRPPMGPMGPFQGGPGAGSAPAPGAGAGPGTPGSPPTVTFTPAPRP